MSTRIPFETRDPTPSAVGQSFALEALYGADAAILVADVDQVVRYRNAMADTLLPDGTKLEAVCSDMRFLEGADGWPDVWRRVLTLRERVVLHVSFTSSDGVTPSLWQMRCHPVLDKDGKGVTAVLLILDLQGAEEGAADRVELSNRLSSLGKLASHVAHELNNPLDGILRYINLAVRLADSGGDERLRSYLLESRTGLMRMMQIIGDLLKFSRTTDGAFDQMDINAVVEQAVKSTAPRARESGVVVTLDFQTDQMPSACGSRLYQVCLNLLRNAIDAMPRGGRLTVTTGLECDQVFLEVADTGVGLPDQADRVFDPFFSTKGAGQGTGLGLAICKEFVESMGGSIEASASPEPEGGAVFTVHIPRGSFKSPSPLAAGRNAGLPG